VTEVDGDGVTNLDGVTELEGTGVIGWGGVTDTNIVVETQGVTEIEGNGVTRFDGKMRDLNGRRDWTEGVTDSEGRGVADVEGNGVTKNEGAIERTPSRGLLAGAASFLRRPLITLVEHITSVVLA
jgi:hypothetical protein